MKLDTVYEANNLHSLDVFQWFLEKYIVNLDLIKMLGKLQVLVSDFSIFNDTPKYMICVKGINILKDQ